MGKIVFNGKSSEDYGVHVARPPDYEIPERNVEIISVPGRNGDLHISKNSYKNVPRSYELNFGSLDKTFQDMANEFVTWLCADSAYHRLSDSYDPDHFRIASFHDQVSVTDMLNHAGSATIEFDCKPQRFLVSGDNSFRFTGTKTITNPTAFEAIPVIEVYGYDAGTIRIGKYTIEVKKLTSTEHTFIDCELENAYLGTPNKPCNNDISIDQTLGYPRLAPGNTEISISGGINSIWIQPRWWEI